MMMMMMTEVGNLNLSVDGEEEASAISGSAI